MTVSAADVRIRIASSSVLCVCVCPDGADNDNKGSRRLPIGRIMLRDTINFNSLTLNRRYRIDQIA